MGNITAIPIQEENIANTFKYIQDKIGRLKELSTDEREEKLVEKDRNTIYSDVIDYVIKQNSEIYTNILIVLKNMQSISTKFISNGKVIESVIGIQNVVGYKPSTHLKKDKDNEYDYNMVLKYIEEGLEFVEKNTEKTPDTRQILLYLFKISLRDILLVELKSSFSVNLSYFEDVYYYYETDSKKKAELDEYIEYNNKLLKRIESIEKTLEK